jgi:hypothetical protein
MKFNTLMTIKAIVCLTFAIILIAIPDRLFDLMGANLEGAGMFAARVYGASLAGNMMLAWYARNLEDSVARRAIILDLLVYDAIGLVVNLYYVLNGTLNWLGWGTVFVYLFITAGFGYFWLEQRSNALPVGQQS